MSSSLANRSLGDDSQTTNFLSATFADDEFGGRGQLTVRQHGLAYLPASDGEVTQKIL